jgi:protein SCO1/2
MSSTPRATGARATRGPRQRAALGTIAARLAARALAAALLALACLPLGAAAHQLDPDELRQVGIDQHPGAQVPLDLVFRDEAGQAVPLRRYFAGRPVVLTLNYFHCPNLCSLVLQRLADRLRGVPLTAGEQYSVLTVSIDPRETPALAAEKRSTTLQGFPGEDAADWHFLTGPEPAIEQLAAAVGFHYLYDAEEDEYVHPAGLVVLTPDGQVSRYLYGLDFTPNDLRLALVEAGQQRIGSLVDQVLLLCYHYDPVTGRYTPVVLGALRLAGLGTLVGLGLFLGLLWREDLRRQRDQSGAAS